MILIAAIRDFYAEELHDESNAKVITGQSLLSLERMGRKTPHFMLSADDHDFFLKRIILDPTDPVRLSVKPDPKKESHDRILEAADVAAMHVKNITSQLPADA